MYKHKEQKLTPNQITFSLSDIKQELENSINDEHKRVNIDSAKKRAVFQHMDYDNFRQMVLGANIKPVKTTEMNDLMGMTNQRSVMNAASTISFLNKEENKSAGVAPEGNLDINEAENARDFKKYFDRILKLNCEKMDTLNIALKYLENIPKEKYAKVFGLDFAVDDLMKIVKVFFEYCQEVEKLPLESVKIFTDFFTDISEVQSFNTSILKWLSKQEKEKLSQLFNLYEEKTKGLSENDQENVKLDAQNYVEKIQKVKSIYKL